MRLLLRYIIYIAVFLFPDMAFSQMRDPVRFEVSQKRLSPTEIALTFQGKIEDGWHVYSTDINEGGPIAASLHVEERDGIELAGRLSPLGDVKEKYDEMFSMNVSYMETKAVFRQTLKITKKRFHISGYLEYGACNEENCLPPAQVPFSIKGADGPEETVVAEEKEDTAVAVSPEGMSVDSAVTSQLPDYWNPVVADSGDKSGDSGNSSLWWIFLMGLAGGLIAVVTPCVWPIIPMTISYFLKRTEHYGKGLRDALLYGLSIIAVYVSLGLLVTLIAGSDGLNSLSTSAGFNIVCFLVLVFFAASFLGGFEIKLPSSWGNRVDSKAEKTGGIVGIFLMALTLTIVSFSCTGPIVGFLLVDLTSSSNYLAPLVGMTGFAVALAFPFTLFALFPSVMRKTPKSGGWMNTVKVTLGFIELAFSLKFLSVADMAYGWHLLDRETFVALWIALFGLLGLYLLGKIHFPADEDRRKASVPSFLLGWVSIAFAVYMLPGLWGAPLKAVSAFTPPLSTQDFKLDAAHEVKAKFSDYDEAVRYARENHKPLLLDFTGFGCVNCRKMEAAVWTDPAVSDLLNNEFVLVSLYVDDRSPLSYPQEVEVNGEKKVLKTKGQLWSFLQSHKFGANTQPYYVPVSPDGSLLNKVCSYDENAGKYADFLRMALKNYQKNK